MIGIWHCPTDCAKEHSDEASAGKGSVPYFGLEGSAANKPDGFVCEGGRNPRQINLRLLSVAGPLRSGI